MLLKAAEMEEDSEKVFKTIEKELTRTKFACFGKVKVCSKDKTQKALENLQVRKHLISADPQENSKEMMDAIDEEMAEKLKVIEKKKLEKDIRQLEALNENKGRSAAVFSLKDKILGNKK